MTFDRVKPLTFHSVLQVHQLPSWKQLILRKSPSSTGFQEKRPWGTSLWTKTLVWCGFDSSSTVRYKHHLLPTTHYQIKCTIDKKSQDNFENRRWNVNYQMMKEQWKVQYSSVVKDEKERVAGSEWYFWLVMLFCTAILHYTYPCKVYADVSVCLHQTKSEMQVEFYVSDIQEVRDSSALWS